MKQLRMMPNTPLSSRFYVLSCKGIRDRLDTYSKLHDTLYSKLCDRLYDRLFDRLDEKLGDRLNDMMIRGKIYEV